jgi:hypothetical protein
MDMQKFSGGSFIKVADVKDGPLKEQIAAVTLGKWDKPNLVFESGSLLSVNATNNQILMRTYGRNSDDWVGKEIELYLGEIEFQEKPQEAVLVRPISPPLKPAERTKLPPEQQQKPAPAPEVPKRDPGHPFNDPVDL